ncbi:hypothetical protein ACROYT_G005963 [Oculina patagonica]
MAASMGICRLPLVVILGSTGTGKSKLAIEIGKIIGGEILSADSMQVYKGLDIITNKVTAEELSQCPHHLIDFVSPLKEFSVVEFRNMALPLIEDIKKRGKVPIIVGGTNYYIESVLWDILIGEDGNSSSSTSSGDEADSPVRAIEKRKKIQSTELAVSAETAGETGAVQGEGAKRSNQSEKMSGKSEACRQRPVERRVYEQHGKPHSEILQEQQQRLGGSAYGGPQRYENACVFWLQCQKEILNERLDKRVDEMLDRGLIEELLNFHQEYNHVLKKKDADSKYTEGIFQSIGFKEFHEFLVKQEGKKFDKSSASVEDKALLTTGIENMKTVTRRYAKKQMTWVRNRFLARPRSSAPDVYGLDATDLKTWETNVLKWALEILDKLMKEEKPLIDPLPRVIIQDDRHARHVCEICDNRIILGEENWKKHLKSKSHKWHVKREERNKEVNSGVINQ